MKAITCKTYGPPEVLKIIDVPDPICGPSDVLIRVKASTVTRYDSWARSCQAHTGMNLWMRAWFGWRKPRQPILGTELSGEVLEVGEGVTRVRVGDGVIAYPGMKMGAYAEKAVVHEEKVTNKPTALDFLQSAGLLQGGMTALDFLQKAKLKAGQKILILGASGGVGLAAVQLAKHHFNADVTGVCSSKKMALVRSLGAKEVLDYNAESLNLPDASYDVIFDTFGKSEFSLGRALKPGGVFLFATYGVRQLLHFAFLRLATKKRPLSPLLNETSELLDQISMLAEKGTLKTVVDKSLPAEDAAEAHRYFDSGKKLGSVVITFDQNAEDQA